MTRVFRVHPGGDRLSILSVSSYSVREHLGPVAFDFVDPQGNDLHIDLADNQTTDQHDRPARPTSTTDQHDRPARPARRPTSTTDQHDRPAHQDNQMEGR